MNIHTWNRDYDRTILYAQKLKPDILAIEEIDNEWAHALLPLDREYPFKVQMPRQDNFGIMLLSRIPLVSPRIVYFGDSGAPSIVTRIRIDNTPVTILLTHPLPPVNHEYFSARNNQLDAIASSRNHFDPHLIVIGDLNTTRWSYHFRKFVSKMRLKDSREGLGIKPSWPSYKPIMRIPIDHCLTSMDIKTRRFLIGPDIGSDHFPVYAELSIPR